MKKVALIVSLLLVATSCRSGSIDTQAVDDGSGRSAADQCLAEANDVSAALVCEQFRTPVPDASSGNESAAEPNETDEPAATTRTPGFIVEEIVPTPTVVREAPTPTPTPSDPSAPTPTPTPAAVQLVQIFDTDDWCSGARKYETNMARLRVAQQLDPVIAEQATEGSIEMTNQLLVIAPDELAGPLNELLDAQTTFADELESVGWSRIDVDPSVSQLVTGQTQVALFALEQYNFETCGFDNGFDPANDPALAESDDPERTGTLREQAITTFSDQGYSQDEAECLAENFDFTNTQQYEGPNGLKPLFDSCGITDIRLNEIFG